MIIDNFNMIGMAILPIKADPPLVIDPDTPLAFSATAQFFQTVPWWNAEKRQCGGTMDLGQFTQSRPLNFLWKGGDKCSFKYLFRILATKRLNHNFHTIEGLKYCQVFIKN
jgi:hypothetical protein